MYSIERCWPTRVTSWNRRWKHIFNISSIKMLDYANRINLVDCRIWMTYCDFMPVIFGQFFQLKFSLNDYVDLINNKVLCVAYFFWFLFLTFCVYFSVIKLIASESNFWAPPKKNTHNLFKCLILLSHAFTQFICSISQYFFEIFLLTHFIEHNEQHYHYSGNLSLSINFLQSDWHEILLLFSIFITFSSFMDLLIHRQERSHWHCKNIVKFKTRIANCNDFDLNGL